MPLNNTGPISLAGATAGQSIAVELGLSATGTISLNQSNVRTLAGVPSGAIIMPTNFYGKSNEFVYTMTSSTLNANLRSLVVAAGWPGTSKVRATINGGVYAYSNSTSTAGLVINGSWPGGVDLINNGFINGRGGSGAPSADRNRGPAPGGAGGLALSVSTPVNVNNASGTIAGGGGGGGGGQNADYPGFYCEGNNVENQPSGFGGGGGGGGRSGLTNAPGGSGGVADYFNDPSGSPGNSGTVNAAGNGGGGGSSGANGGGWGAPGGSSVSSGGGGGAATSGGPSFITYTATGTRFGTIG